MEGVKEVKQLDGKRLHWKAEFAGRETEWDAEITEQLADQRLVVTNRGGAIQGLVQHFANSRTTGQRLRCKLSMTLRVSSNLSAMHREWNRCVSRETWSSSKDSLKSVGSGQVATQSSIISPCRCTKPSDGQNSTDPVRASQTCRDIFKITFAHGISPCSHLDRLLSCILGRSHD